MVLSKVWKFANKDIKSPKIIKTVQVLVGLTAGLVLYSLLWHLFMYLELNFLDGIYFFVYYNTTLWILGEITIFLLSEILGVWITFKAIRSINQRTTKNKRIHFNRTSHCHCYHCHSLKHCHGLHVRIKTESY